MIVGKRYSAKNTLVNKKNGLAQGEEGFVTFVDGAAISLEFTRINIELKVPRNLFGFNFIQSTLDTHGNVGYKKNKHASTEFKA